MKYLSRTTIEWAVAIGLAFGVAATGGSLTVLDEWYYNLVQPWFKPPDLLFGPVWTVLFSLMAWSGVLAWRSEASDPQATAARRSVLMRLWAFNALTNVTLPYAVDIADYGWRGALQRDASLRPGLNVHAGAVTYPAVAESFGMECLDISDVLA